MRKYLSMQIVFFTIIRIIGCFECLMMQTMVLYPIIYWTLLKIKWNSQIIICIQIIWCWSCCISEAFWNSDLLHKFTPSVYLKFTFVENNCVTPHICNFLYKAQYIKLKMIEYCCGAITFYFSGIIQKKK